jgi:hypothetical protein
VHVVWDDRRDGNDEIYYKVSRDAGTTWGPDVRLTNAPDYSLRPSIAVSGSYVHATWNDNRDGDDCVFYRRSTDCGRTWQADSDLSHDPAESSDPCTAARDADVYVTWTDVRAGSEDVFFKHSGDNGQSWGPDTRLTTDTASSWNTSIAVVESTLHVCWCDDRDSAWAVYYRRSSDCGESWGPEARLSDLWGHGANPFVAAAGQHVYAVWPDNRDGNGEIYFKRSDNSGSSWGPDTRLTFDSASSGFPELCASGSNVHAVWMDDRDGNSEIYYKNSSDHGASWGPDVRLTNKVGNSGLASITTSGWALHAVWMDDRDGNWEIYCKRDLSGNPAVEEPPALHGELREGPVGAVTRGVLWLPVGTDTEPGEVASLLDISGRKLMDLRPGPNDVRHLSPGVYFVQIEANCGRSTRKTVLTE